LQHADMDLCAYLCVGRGGVAVGAASPGIKTQIVCRSNRLFWN